MFTVHDTKNFFGGKMIWVNVECVGWLQKEGRAGGVGVGTELTESDSGTVNVMADGGGLVCDIFA